MWVLGYATRLPQLWCISLIAAGLAHNQDDIPHDAFMPAAIALVSINKASGSTLTSAGLEHAQ